MCGGGACGDGGKCVCIHVVINGVCWLNWGVYSMYVHTCTICTVCTLCTVCTHCMYCVHVPYVLFVLYVLYVLCVLCVLFHILHECTRVSMYTWWVCRGSGCVLLSLCPVTVHCLCCSE